MALEIEIDPSEVGLDAARLARIATHFDAYVEDRRLPGWLATVSRGGQLAWTGRGGHRDREQNLAVENDTLWRIYSMTKPLTSIGAMILYEEGHFDLNDEVSRWIGEFADARVYQSGPGSAPVTIPATEPVRVAHLLSHMSGLTYGFNYTHPVDAIYREKGYDFGWPPGADLARAVADWASSPLLFQPGTKWNYSVATDVLGRLIEIWSGQSLDRFFRERILDPLAMADTDWWCPPEKAERLAQIYVPSNGASVPFEHLGRHSFTWPSMLGGGGGLIASAADYQRFMTMLLHGGELDGVRLLSSRTLALMVENHLPDDTDLASLATDSFSESDFAGVGFGLGFSVVLDRRANRSLVSEGTFGWGGAASTVFWVDPLEELTVSFFTQLLPSGTYPIRRELQRLVYSSLVD
ncbi:MAG: beta-lactamase family protein [Acidobacteriota bacterium]|nr:beta-lactamase family protein [Acidobacteriota bacterium]